MTTDELRLTIVPRAHETRILMTEVETIVGKRGVSTALGAIEEGSERGCASRRSARARGGADEEVLDDVGSFNASDDLLIAAA
jgi:hypothetical protein